MIVPVLLLASVAWRQVPAPDTREYFPAPTLREVGALYDYEATVLSQRVEAILRELWSAQEAWDHRIGAGWRLHKYLHDAARRNRVPPALILAICLIESDGNPRALSRSGARGVMQIVPATGAAYGLSRRHLFDPVKNLNAGTQLLRDLQAAHGPFVAVMAYNHGATRIRQSLQTGRYPPGALWYAAVVASKATALLVALRYKGGFSTAQWPTEGLVVARYGLHLSGTGRNRRRAFHQGVDIRAPAGTQVIAAAPGVVSLVVFDRVYGKTVVVSHDKRTASVYARLDSVEKRIGDIVSEDDVLGKVALRAEQPDDSQLHWELLRASRLGTFHPVDPMKFIPRS